MSLKEQVISMLETRLKNDGVYRLQIIKDLRIQGKYGNHKIDVFFQFIQMNNLEKNVVKIVENRAVTNSDIWEFHTILDDLNYFAKGIIYSNSEIPIEVKNEAERAGIELIKFDLNNEINKFVGQMVLQMVPDENVIGDPFWTLMEVQDGHNTGNYFSFNDGIVLSFSKKQMQKICECLNNNYYKVFGVSQDHLLKLLKLIKSFKKDVFLVSPNDTIEKWPIPLIKFDEKKLIDWYVREENE